MANAIDLVEMMGTSMGKIKEMVDVNTVVGTPIFCPDNSTIIPVSKCSFGFAVGGSEFGATNSHFGGGSGAGVNVQPIAFLVITPQGQVSLLPVTAPATNSIERAIEMAPTIVDKITALIKKKDTEEVAPL